MSLLWDDFYNPRGRRAASALPDSFSRRLDFPSSPAAQRAFSVAREIIGEEPFDVVPKLKAVDLKAYWDTRDAIERSKNSLRASDDYWSRRYRNEIGGAWDRNYISPRGNYYKLFPYSSRNFTVSPYWSTYPYSSTLGPYLYGSTRKYNWDLNDNLDRSLQDSITWKYPNIYRPRPVREYKLISNPSTGSVSHYYYRPSYLSTFQSSPSYSYSIRSR